MYPVLHWGCIMLLSYILVRRQTIKVTHCTYGKIFFLLKHMYLFLHCAMLIMLIIEISRTITKMTIEKPVSFYCFYVNHNTHNNYVLASIYIACPDGDLEIFNFVFLYGNKHIWGDVAVACLLQICKNYITFVSCDFLRKLSQVSRRIVFDEKKESDVQSCKPIYMLSESQFIRITFKIT